MAHGPALGTVPQVLDALTVAGMSRAGAAGSRAMGVGMRRSLWGGAALEGGLGSGVPVGGASGSGPSISLRLATAGAAAAG